MKRSFRAYRSPAVTLLHKGTLIRVFDASAIARQFGFRDRMYLTRRAMAAFVPLQERTNDYQLLHAMLGLKFVLPFTPNATYYSWTSTPDIGESPIHLTAQFERQSQEYYFLIDLDGPE